MVTGLKIINDHGTILLDSEVHSLVLRAKGTRTGTGTITITNTTSPVLALACSTNTVGIVEVSTSGTSKTFKVQTSNPSAVIEWYHFDKIYGPPSSSGFGLQMFNSAGEVTYDTMYKPMRVASVGTSPSYMTAGPGDQTKILDTKNIDFPTGRKYAVAIDATAAYFDEYEEQVAFGGGYIYRYRYGNAIGSRVYNTGTAERVVIGGLYPYSAGWTAWSDPPVFMQPFPDANFYGMFFNYMVLDVTNY